MKLSRKLFLSIFITSLIVCSFITAYTFVELKKSHQNEFQSKYTAISNGITSNILQFEEMMKTIMEATAFHVEETIKSKGMISNKELSDISKLFSVSGMGIANSKGEFVRNTNKKFSTDKINLFSLCKEYKNFFVKNLKIVETPIMPSRITNKTYKFLVKSILSGRYVLNMGSQTFFLGEAFKNILSFNPKLNGMALYTASGKKMAEQKSEEFKNRVLSDTQGNDVFIKIIPTKNGRTCCECKEKGLMDAKGDYYYKLVLNVSRDNLKQKIITSAQVSSVLFLALVFISFILSQRLSKLLISEIDHINSGLKNIMSTNDLNYRFNESGSKEINQLENNLNKMVKSLKNYQKEQIHIERERGIAESNRQIAHDIRSPLSALSILVKATKGLPDETRGIIQSVTQRIEGIANKLLSRSDELQKQQTTLVSNAVTRPVVIAQRLKEVVEEKIMQISVASNIELNLTIEPEAQLTFSKIDAIELYRIMSNIINNSTDSMSGQGQVLVHLEANKIHNIISIQDNGSGISKTHLPFVFGKEATFNKLQGTGLGLYHAKALIESWGGQIYIESKQGVGTEVVIEIPITRKPSWYVSQIVLKNISTVVVIDDNEEIFKAWQLKLKHCSVDLKYFSSPDEDLDELRKLNSLGPEVLYLVDYEFDNSKLNGIKIIEQLEIKDKSILVTGASNNLEVLEYCDQTGLRYLYKGQIETIEIV